ncbi:hypothetical protein [Lederbergia citri]|uniref:Sigma-X negative effector n=1 Tax=Lederbergia citri TaxID=2833580 RepID=A0A942TB70_9BACI|nr:hypothetical protein [Lederbergia citri]MBS4194535.1 hypothetical protein [Lederbergia citri]
MRHSDREDDKIIKLIKQLPSVEDKRPMDEIYRNIKLGMNKKERKPIFIPVLTSVAGLLIFLLAFPFIFQTAPTDYLSSRSKESADSGGMANQAAESRKLEKDINQDNQEITMYSEETTDKISTLNTAVYEKDALENEVYTYGVVTKDAIVIPITLLKPGKSNGDWISQYRSESKVFDAREYGFQDFSPLMDAIDIDKETGEAKVKISPENRPFFEANEMLLKDMLQFLLQPQDVNMVKFVNGNEDPVELSHFGVLQDQTIEKNLKRGYFLYRIDENSQYLIPGNGDSKTLEEALEYMKTKPDDIHHSVIPDAVSPEVAKEDASDVTIKFDKTIALDQGDQLKNMQLIEGILLTAKEFGKTEVQFENIKPSHWENFQFDQPVKVPIAPNLIKR